MEIWLVAGIAIVVAVGTFVLLNRRGGEVIDAPRPASSARQTVDLPAPTVATTTPTSATDESDMTASDMISAEGADGYLEALATWIEDRALEDLGSDVAQPGPTRRVANAARQALADLRAQGRAAVALPALVSDASGPKDFGRELEFGALDRMLIDDYALTVAEVLRGHGEDRHVVALGLWIMTTAEHESERGLDCDVENVLRVADAARKAWADFAQSGRAEVELKQFGGEPAFDFRCTIDHQTMPHALKSLDLTDQEYAKIRAEELRQG